MKRWISLVALMLFCSVSCGQEKELEFIESLPYRVRKGCKSYTFCRVDFRGVQDGKYSDLCEVLFQSHVFFSAWPDVITKSRDLFIIVTSEIAVLRGDTLQLFEEIVFFVNRESGVIMRFEPEGEVKHKCGKQELEKLESLKMKEVLYDEITICSMFDHLASSNMHRIEENGAIIWEYGKSRFPVVNIETSRTR